MPEITKHDCKQKGERDDGKDTRVDFTIRGHAICVDNGLECLSEFVGAVVSWGRFSGREFVEDGCDS